MSDAVPADQAGDPQPAAAPPGVTAALEGLTALDGAPVSEHVAVFEQAHARLRSVLDGPTAPPPPVRPADG